MTDRTPAARPTEALASGGPTPSEEQIAAGLAEFDAAAETLRRLDLVDAEPELAFDAGWEPAGS